MNASIIIDDPVELGDGPTIRPRSRLYCLEPVALETGIVESLTSYISRLATAHSLAVAALVRGVIAPLAKRSSLSGIAGHYDILKNASPSINGNAEISAECIRVLRLLTRNDSLERLTMRFTAGWLATRPLISGHQKWCSQCLQQMRETGGTIYYPLIWQLEHLVVCPTHKRLLTSQCVRCGKSHRPLCGNMVVGHCPHCSAWLGFETVIPEFRAENAMSHRILLLAARQLRGFVEASGRCPRGESLAWSANVERLVRQQPNGSANRLATQLGIDHGTIAAWMTRKQLPSLTSILLIGCVFDVDIVQLVSADLPSETSLRQSLPKSDLLQMFRRPLEKRDGNLLRQVMTKAAESPGYPPQSVAKVCRQVGCHQSYAARKFPELAKRIKAHRRYFVQNRKQQRQFFTGLVTKSVASRMAASGQYPSHRRMSENLPSWISMRDSLVRKAWWEILEEWGLEGDRA